MPGQGGKREASDGVPPSLLCLTFPLMHERRSWKFKSHKHTAAVALVVSLPPLSMPLLDSLRTHPHH